MRFAVAALMLAGASAAAETEIHRCLLDDGTIAFQEMPCPDAAEKTDDQSAADEPLGDNGVPTNDDVFDFVNPFDEPEDPPTNSPETHPETASQNRAECEKTTRDAIDAIDLEMRENAYTKEQGDEYLSELLTLTRQLRACKQL